MSPTRFEGGKEESLRFRGGISSLFGPGPGGEGVVCSIQGKKAIGRDAMGGGNPQLLVEWEKKSERPRYEREGEGGEQGTGG